MPVTPRTTVSMLVLLLAPLLSVVAGEPPRVEADGSLIARRLPRVVHRGGAILRHPEVTTVTFAGEPPATARRLDAFGDFITGSPWWAAVTDGYCPSPGDCIGEGRPGRHVRIDSTLPSVIRDVDVERLLDRQARAGPLSRLAPDALVLVYLPRGVTLRDAYHAHYCHGGPRAYHRMLRLEDTAFPYAVIPRCGDEAELTGVASHEILEATTNPDPDRPGFHLEAGGPSAAFAASGSEPVDPCGVLTRDGHWTFESGFAVQRAWSNRAAAKGHDPCVPSDPEAPYVALVPRVSAVRLAAVGATATIELDAASDRPVERWSVSAIDLTGDQGGERYVDTRLDRAEVAGRTVAVLRLRLVRVHPRQMSVVGLVSTLGPHSYLWPLAVSMR